MIIIKTMSFTNLSDIFIIDLLIFIILIGILLFREFLNLYLAQKAINQSYTKLYIERSIIITMLPFFYIFIYVLIFRILYTMYLP